ncbi:hypothetical protein BJV77DRAFT_1069595 [Russula vinacea]|nr:hypothetical protein BJV77DRAFT_1069595 [Russula vinacea]
MPLRRILNTFCRVSSPCDYDEDAVMSDATTSTANTPALSPLAPSRSVNGSSLLGKRRARHEQSSVKPAVGTSSTTPSRSTGDISSPLVSPTTHTSTPDALPSKRPKPSLSLNHPIDNTVPEPSTPPPPPPLPIVPSRPLRPPRKSPTTSATSSRCPKTTWRLSQSPRVFDPVPSLIAADWHMRNPEKNYGLLSPKGLFRLIKMGWLSVADVRLNLHPREYAALAQYNDRPDEQRYPFVVVPPGQPIPTPSQRVRLRRQAGLCSHPDDVPDSEFFGTTLRGSRMRGGGSASPPVVSPYSSAPAETSASSSGVVVEEAEVVVEEPKPKRRRSRNGLL